MCMYFVHSQASACAGWSKPASQGGCCKWHSKHRCGKGLLPVSSSLCNWQLALPWARWMELILHLGHAGWCGHASRLPSWGYREWQSWRCCGKALCIWLSSTLKLVSCENDWFREIVLYMQTDASQPPPGYPTEAQIDEALNPNMVRDCNKDRRVKFCHCMNLNYCSSSLA